MKKIFLILGIIIILIVGCKPVMITCGSEYSDNNVFIPYQTEKCIAKTREIVKQDREYKRSIEQQKRRIKHLQSLDWKK
jgi:hypothetical protein